MILYAGTLNLNNNSNVLLTRLKPWFSELLVQGEIHTTTKTKLVELFKFAKENDIKYLELWHADIINDNYSLAIDNRERM
jgi:hypothetical protein